MRRLITALLLAASTAASAAYPEKPIRLVVHFPAGSSTDVIGRILAQSFSARLGQPVVVDNKPGADGGIAAMEVKRAAPDGYTLMLATNTPMSGAPMMRTTLGYDPVKDFTPITDVGRYTFFLLLNAQLPPRTLAEFLDYARARPGKLNYGSGNVTGQLAFASIAHAAQLDMTHVPYKGEPPAITDLVGGRLDGMVATAGTSVPHVQSGKLRALAVVAERRAASLPDVPTLREAGFSGFTIEPWLGLFGPANLPRDVVERLSKAFAASAKDPEVLKKLVPQDFALNPSTPEELGALVRRQLEIHRELGRIAGIKPD
jgi:tripartite-type tricarboxylate transporter receptor subunit TctC